MSTIDDLKEAFADESQTSVRYLTFARKAREEGHEDVARLFEDAAMDELCYAQRNLELMQGISSTENNLQSAINGEAAEYINKYPNT
jgi:rubrerythrin